MPAGILVVDAVATNRILWKAKLRGAYAKVYTADTVAGALTQLRVNRPEIAILGVNTAKMIRAIRSDPAGLDVPIIVIGRSADTPNPQGLLRLGADRLLTAPVEETELLASIQHLLERKRALQSATPEPVLWGLSEPDQKPL